MWAVMERVASSANLNQAYKHVKANRGAPGGDGMTVDGMTVDDLGPWLVDHKDELVVQLLRGTYQPQPVKGRKTPKPGGGVRQLGIPTAGITRNGGRPPGPAGHTASPTADPRPDLLGVELRFPPGAQRS